MLFILAFGVSCISGLFGVAFSNVLLFERAYSAQSISILNAVFSAGYTFIPLLLIAFIKQISKQKTLRLSVCGITFLYAIMLFLDNFYLFFIIRILDGALNGLFWSNIEASLSDINDSETNQETISKYNLSWNLGLIVSSLIGVILVPLITLNYYLLYLCTVGMALMVPIAFYFSPANQKSQSSKSLQSDRKNPQGADALPITAESTKWVVPLYPLLFLVMIYGIVVSSISVLIPVQIQMLGLGSFYVYLLFFSRTATASLYSLKKPSKEKRGLTDSNQMIILSFLLLFGFLALTASGSLVLMIMVNILFGYATVKSYSVSLDLILHKNEQKNTSRYSVYYQCALGISSSLAPFIIGFYISQFINLVYLSLGILSFTIALIGGLGIRPSKHLKKK